MNTDFLSVIILTLTVVLMWIGYVQILNYLDDKEKILKAKQKNGKALTKIKWIKKGLILQCFLFSLVVGLSLYWLYDYLITNQIDGFFKFILIAFIVSQIIHFITFSYSYISWLWER